LRGFPKSISLFEKLSLKRAVYSIERALCDMIYIWGCAISLERIPEEYFSFCVAHELAAVRESSQDTRSISLFEKHSLKRALYSLDRALCPLI